MTTIWIQPPSGELLNGDQPWRRADQADIPLSFISPPDTLAIIGGALPPGLYFNAAARRIQGVVGALPKDQTSYPVLFRATYLIGQQTQISDRSFVLPVDALDEQQQFTGDQVTQSQETAWLAALWAAGGNQMDQGNRIHYLGSVTRGQTANIQLQIDNPDDDQLTYKVIGYKVGNQPAGLPVGLEIDSFGRISGSALFTNNSPGEYYFRIYVRAPNRSEGQPKSSMKVFRLTLTTQLANDGRYSDVVRWITTAGSLGSTYETYASHFSVQAAPQYLIQNTLGQETQTIRYQLASESGPLPSGLILQPNSGLITGKCPYMNVNTTFTFTVQAQVVFINNITGQIRASTIISKRTFSLTILSIFFTNSVMSLEFSVPPLERLLISQFIYGTKSEVRNSQSEPGVSVPHMLTILSKEKLFRPTDELFGKVSNLRINLVRGLKLKTGQQFVNHLRDYHHATKLRIGELKSAKANDPDGRYIYDVIYLTIIDPLEGAGGFDSQQREEALPYRSNQSISSWSQPSNSSQYYPQSIKNLRDDLIITTNRLYDPANNENSVDRGIGVDGKEALPLWQLTEQQPGNPQSIPGYQSVIELAYLLPGQGASAVKSLKQSGFEQQVSGGLIDLDRYLLVSDGIENTVWDATNDTLTTFDGPNNPDTPTANPTTFDLRLRPLSTYYKFPPGDVPDILPANQPPVINPFIMDSSINPSFGALI